LPLCIAVAVLEELGEPVVLEELEEELLQALTASPTQAMDTNAAIRVPRRWIIVTICST
jgi:hypothetical protein